MPEYLKTGLNVTALEFTGYQSSVRNSGHMSLYLEFLGKNILNEFCLCAVKYFLKGGFVT